MDQKTGGTVQPSGQRQFQVTRDLGMLQQKKVSLAWQLRNWLRYRYREAPALAASRFLGGIAGLLLIESELQGRVYRADWSKLAPWQILELKRLLAENHPVFDLPRYFGGQVTDYGVLSTRKVTTAGVNYITDAFQNLAELEDMKFHGYGTGTTAESNAQTALITELTTEYVVNSTRPTGSQGEGATANVYRTTATLSPDSGGTLAITEHGVFSAAAAGTLLDRSVFSAINLVAGSDSLQTQYDLTLPAEA